MMKFLLSTVFAAALLLFGRPIIFGETFTEGKRVSPETVTLKSGEYVWEPSCSLKASIRATSSSGIWSGRLGLVVEQHLHAFGDGDEPRRAVGGGPCRDPLKGERRAADTRGPCLDRHDLAVERLGA